ncbi:MAG: YlbF family regulator [Wujia sp.]
MKEVINQSKQINEHIKQTSEYKKYIDTKKALYDNIELCNMLKEFRNRNYELQNRVGVNPYDEVSALVREYDELLHNSIVSDFLRAEQRICKLMQQVYNAIAEGLEFDYPDE